VACTSTGCSTSEYGDDHDVMGGYTAAHFNAFQKERLGWLNYGASPSIQSVTATGDYAIDLYETPDAGRPKALQILKSSAGSSNTFIYAEARSQYGVDASLAPGVLIHTGVDTDANQSFIEDVQPSTSATDFILDPGQSFTFSDAGQNITLTTLSLDGSGAVIHVALSCGYSLTPTAQAFGPSGGPGSVSLTTGTGCPWTASSPDSWLTIDAASTSGVGSSNIQFTAASNTSSLTRIGTLTIADQTFTVTQTSSAPSITALSPASGPVGTTVTITGTNFGATKGTSTVTFNGTLATPTAWSATSITVPV